MGQMGQQFLTMTNSTHHSLSRCPAYQLSGLDLRPMFFDMRLRRFRSMVHCMFVVAASEVCMMRCRLVFPCVVVLGGLLVMTSRVFVMLCCFVMMIDRLL